MRPAGHARSAIAAKGGHGCASCPVGGDRGRAAMTCHSRSRLGPASGITTSSAVGATDGAVGFQAVRYVPEGVRLRRGGAEGRGRRPPSPARRSTAPASTPCRPARRHPDRRPPPDRPPRHRTLRRPEQSRMSGRALRESPAAHACPFDPVSFPASVSPTRWMNIGVFISMFSLSGSLARFNSSSALWFPCPITPGFPT